jgi:hypothetical protein
VSDYLSAERFLYTKLSEDATLIAMIGGAGNPRIYGEVAPHEINTYPLVVHQYQGGRDVQGLGAVIVMVDELYVVKVITVGRAYADGEPVWKRIQAVLHGSSGVVTDGLVLACVRVSPIKYATLEEGVEYRHLGGIFRIYSQ